MRTRTILLLAGVLLLGAVVLGGASMALAWGRSGTTPWSATPGSMMGQSGQHPMMGPNGYGPMMGPNGHGSMMGGQYGSATQGTPAVGVTQVQIVNFAYTPANIQVKAGTTVTWTNQDTAPHSVTFKNGMKDSGILQKGQTFSYTFTTPGTYQYYCTVHPYMTAIVTVTP
ncbi:MAG TPA: cupredoxin family copper-binding protein [Ktedonobacterales bacterium]